MSRVFFSSSLLNGYDELKTLSYAIPLICPIGADVRQSGVSELEENAPFVLWLGKLYQELGGRETGPVTPDKLDSEPVESWGKWLPNEALWVSFGSPEDGGVLFAREDPWSEQETCVLKGLAETYGDVAKTFSARKKRISPPVGWNRKRTFLSIGISAMLLSGFIPVPLTVLAPAEIVAANPEVVRSPLGGVISKMHIRPNQPITAGQPLFDLDPVIYKQKLEVAEKAMAAARAEYEQSSQKALFDLSEKARLSLLRGRVKEQETEVAYLKKILSRINVKAMRGGVAIIDDANEWNGRPVTIGERVMAISDERDTEVEAWLAVGNAIDLKPGAPVIMFLNSAPLKPVGAVLRYAGYRAQSRPDGTLAYRVRAKINNKERNPRLGLRGTVRIEADRVSLLYWLFRRPFAQIRQILGV